MARAVIALGSNLGQRAEALARAVAALSLLPQTRLLRQAPVYETAPVEVPPEFADLRFLNSAVLVETALSPEALLAELNRLEAEAGRVRTVKNGPRTLDLDLILYEGARRDTPQLTLPHPRAHLRDFVLRPLADLGLTRDDLLANRFPEAPQRAGRVHLGLLALLVVALLGGIGGFVALRPARPAETQALVEAQPGPETSATRPSQTASQALALPPLPAINQAGATRRLEAHLAAMQADETVKLLILLRPGEAERRFAEQFPAAEVLDRSLVYNQTACFYLVRASRDTLAQLLDAFPGPMESLEIAPPLTLFNSVATSSRFLGVAPLRTETLPGLDGHGEVVAVIDTGISSGDYNTLHRDLKPAILGMVVEPSAAAYGATTPKDYDGHGTHVAGSIVSRGSFSGSTLADAGAAPGARLFFQAFGTSSGSLVAANDISAHFTRSLSAGASIISCSWGHIDSAYVDYYPSLAALIDTFVWQHPEVLICFAAGNTGTDADKDGQADSQTIRSHEALAKNALIVGAQESYRPGSDHACSDHATCGSPISSDTDASPYDGLHDGVALFSAQGPLSDERIAPMLLAPGSRIRSTTRSSLTSYGYMCGTSMATPLVAGSAAVLRQYLREIHAIERPTAALLRAALILCADSLAPGQYTSAGLAEVPEDSPNSVEGWGALRLGTHLSGEQTFGFADRLSLSAAGTSTTLTIPDVLAGGEIVAVLSWIDAPGTANSAPESALMNDYDLTLIAPDGTETTLDDHKNPIERLRLTATQAGTYTLRVSLSTLSKHAAGNLAAVAWRADTEAGAPALPEALSAAPAAEEATLAIEQPTAYATYTDTPPMPGTYRLPLGSTLSVSATTTASGLAGWTLQKTDGTPTQGTSRTFSLELDQDATLRWHTAFPGLRLLLR